MSEPQVSPAKIRVGLVMVAVLFVASIVLIATVNDPIGRAIFFAAALTALVRGWLLVRWIRKGGPTRSAVA
jgi:hypothetical protein